MADPLTLRDALAGAVYALYRLTAYTLPSVRMADRWAAERALTIARTTLTADAMIRDRLDRACPECHVNLWCAWADGAIYCNHCGKRGSHGK